MGELADQTVDMIMDLFGAVYGPLRNDSMLRARVSLLICAALSTAYGAGEESAYERSESE